MCAGERKKPEKKEKTPRVAAQAVTAAVIEGDCVRIRIAAQIAQKSATYAIASKVDSIMVSAKAPASAGWKVHR